MDLNDKGQMEEVHALLAKVSYELVVCSGALVQYCWASPSSDVLTPTHLPPSVV